MRARFLSPAKHISYTTQIGANTTSASENHLGDRKHSNRRSMHQNKSINEIKLMYFT